MLETISTFTLPGRFAVVQLHDDAMKETRFRIRWDGRPEVYLEAKVPDFAIQQQGIDRLLRELHVQFDRFMVEYGGARYVDHQWDTGHGPATVETGRHGRCVACGVEWSYDGVPHGRCALASAEGEVIRWLKDAEQWGGDAGQAPFRHWAGARGDHPWAGGSGSAPDEAFEKIPKPQFGIPCGGECPWDYLPQPPQHFNFGNGGITRIQDEITVDFATMADLERYNDKFTTSAGQMGRAFGKQIGDMIDRMIVKPDDLKRLEDAMKNIGLTPLPGGAAETVKRLPEPPPGQDGERR